MNICSILHFILLYYIIFYVLCYINYIEVAVYKFINCNLSITGCLPVSINNNLHCQVETGSFQQKQAVFVIGSKTKTKTKSNIKTSIQLLCLLQFGQKLSFYSGNLCTGVLSGEKFEDSSYTTSPRSQNQVKCSPLEFTTQHIQL